MNDYPAFCIGLTVAGILFTSAGCSTNGSTETGAKPRAVFVRSGSSGGDRAAKSGGQVIVEVTLNPEGQVKKALIVESSGDAKLNQIALVSVRNRRFVVSDENPNTVRRVVYKLNPDGGSPSPMQADWGF